MSTPDIGLYSTDFIKQPFRIAKTTALHNIYSSLKNENVFTLLTTASRLTTGLHCLVSTDTGSGTVGLCIYADSRV